MIDRWFPVAAVDDACGTPAGSGRVEKAIFTWFASRPIAQARAAALTALLPDDAALKPLIEAAVRRGDRDSIDKLAKRVIATYRGSPPVVLDMFSGRAIIPLEAARAGANAIGIDLSPVATLAGRLLADYPTRDWSAEPVIPLLSRRIDTLDLRSAGRGRLVQDVEVLLAEVGHRITERMSRYYPRNERGEFPWGLPLGYYHPVRWLQASLSSPRIARFKASVQEGARPRTIASIAHGQRLMGC